MVNNYCTDQNYVEILEKTNQQLSLWFNPYGVMVAVLTALIAFLAIAFAFILWRQGKEYKELFQTFINEQKKIAEIEFESARQQNQVLVQDLVSETRKRLETETGEVRVESEKRLKELKNLELKLTRPLSEYSIPVTNVIGVTGIHQGGYGISDLVSGNVASSYNIGSWSRLTKTKEQRSIEDLQAQVEALLKQVENLQKKSVTAVPQGDAQVRTP